MLIKKLQCLCLVLLISGCATTKNNPDPLEPYNRVMFKLNSYSYDYIFNPINSGYTTITPGFFRNGVTNFFDNTFEFPRTGNSILQGEFTSAGRHALRFTLNTIFGVFGLVDVAQNMGLPAQTNTFGMTLARWGYTNSAYLVLPFLGPSTIRDTIGMVPDYFMDPLNLNAYFSPNPVIHSGVAYAMTGLYVINANSVFLPKYYAMTEYAIDPYIATRNAYLQYTNARIKRRFNTIERTNVEPSKAPLKINNNTNATPVNM
jgi:phospholipid-binding lipoprotein MlaA